MLGGDANLGGVADDRWQNCNPRLSALAGELGPDPQVDIDRGRGEILCLSKKSDCTKKTK